jgi:anthranilate phosphoribosyltransferase
VTSGAAKGKTIAMIIDAIAKIIEGFDLSKNEMVDVMSQILNGQASDAQISAFMTALRLKGETVEEIAGAAQVMRDKATKINAKTENIVDTCGTGGDGTKTFNISTTAAFITAGAGVTVAKHGNRSVSSQSGSADVLKALGVNIDVEERMVEQCLNEIGIGFLFAPKLHGAMKYAIGPRREIRIRTIFNILGPLSNPAGAKNQVIGVYDPKLTGVLANVLKDMGSKHVMVVHGKDGMDEITLTTTTSISELKNNVIKEYYFNPRDYGLDLCKPADLLGGDSEENAKITTSILLGVKGPQRNIALLNAAAAIMVGQKADNFPSALSLAEESIDSGEAYKKLEKLIKLTQE